MRIEKNFIIKALIYTFVTIVFTVLQTNVFESLKVFNLKPNLIILLVIAVSILENERYGAIFGLICGFIFDVGFGSPFLISGIFYFVAAYMVGTITRVHFKKALLTMIIAILPVCFVQEIINLFYLIALWDKFNFIDAFLYYITPEYIYTVALAPPVYILIKFTAGRFRYSKI